jgi:hypothetical protein
MAGEWTFGRLPKRCANALAMGFPHPVIAAHKRGERYRLRRGKRGVPPGAVLGAGPFLAEFAFVGSRNLMPDEPVVPRERQARRVVSRICNRTLETRVGLTVLRISRGGVTPAEELAKRASNQTTLRWPPYLKTRKSRPCTSSTSSSSLHKDTFRTQQFGQCFYLIGREAA